MHTMVEPTDTRLTELLTPTWEGPVFGEGHAFSERTPEKIGQVGQYLGAVAIATSEQLTNHVKLGMPEWGQETVVQIVDREILPKTIVFVTALTDGEINDEKRLIAATSAVTLMYFGDQTLDRGDKPMSQALGLLGQNTRIEVAAMMGLESPVTSRFIAISHIEDYVKSFARPEDVSLVLRCFYDQVLHNEVAMHELSQAYFDGGRDKVFLDGHAAKLADITTVSAGFPSVSSSLYAIYRQHKRELPSLSEVYANKTMTDLLQACNVVVRIWDELGDWEMDAGLHPEKGVPVINPLNEYHPDFVQRFGELAFLSKDQIAGLQYAMKQFHYGPETQQANQDYILTMLSDHVRKIFADLPQEVQTKFEQYITLCKRVVEIGYVNKMGDIELSAPKAA
jgi:hypothetical protein